MANWALQACEVHCHQAGLQGCLLPASQALELSALYERRVLLHRRLMPVHGCMCASSGTPVPENIRPVAAITNVPVPRMVQAQTQARSWLLWFWKAGGPSHSQRGWGMLSSSQDCCAVYEEVHGLYRPRPRQCHGCCGPGQQGAQHMPSTVGGGCDWQILSSSQACDAACV